MDEIIKREDALFKHISKLIDEAHKHVKTTVNTAMVYTYYGVGKYIVEDEQQGYERAAYGKKVLKALSEKLCLKYGEGWSYSNLRQIRQFYLAYANLTDGVCQIQFDLSWSHYLICVLRIMMSATSMRLRRNNRNRPDGILTISQCVVFDNFI